MAGSAKGGDHFWPGFVDALTNVVIAMVFVIVVLAIALSFSAQLLAQRMAARIAELEQRGRAPAMTQAVPSNRGAADATGPQAGPVAEAQPRDARAPVVERIAVRGTERDRTPPKGVEVTPAARRLLLEYEPGALTLDATASKKLAEALDAFKAALDREPAPSRVSIVARGPSMSLSENQRAGYIRVMTVRNVLLEQGLPADRIDVRLDTRAGADKNVVDISLEARR